MRGFGDRHMLCVILSVSKPGAYPLLSNRVLLNFSVIQLGVLVVSLNN